MSRYTTVEEQVEYGLDGIDPSRTVQVSLRDLVFVYKTIGELQRFFHQPLHYPSLVQVQRFVGNRDRGAYHLIAECYYQKLRDVFPPDIAAALAEDRLYPAEFPDYYDPNYGSEEDAT
jgi:hypothetical protein